MKRGRGGGRAFVRVGHSFCSATAVVIRNAIVAVALSACACATGQRTVVRELAAYDLPCRGDQVTVTRLSKLNKEKGDWALSGLRGKAIYRADGCGQQTFYVCEGWDSYEQRSLCRPKLGPE